MQHFLASRQTVDIPIKHLFIEYKFWIERERPFSTVREELATLARQGSDFRRLIDPKKDDILRPIATFLNRFDIGTAYPLLLHMLDVGLSDEQWGTVSTVLESYLLRRAVCGLTPKNYNRVFLTLTRILRRDGISVENIQKHLSDLSGGSTEWPTDVAFRTAWETQHAYQTMQQVKIIHILRRLSDTYLNSKSEQIDINCPLTVEHILPQNWIENWPLPDGSKGLTMFELWDKPQGDPQGDATRRRNSALQTLGNLTILTQALNSSVSNSGWKDKKLALLTTSLLPINQQLHTFESWDETSIEVRSKGLFERALRIWPRPT